MTWSWDRVVKVGNQAGDRIFGTGALIAAGRVLTARHVVFTKDGQVRPDLAVCLAGAGKFEPATIAWPGEGGLDVAVLAAPALGTRARAPLSPREFVAQAWETKGYPIVDTQDPNRALKSVGGTARSYSVLSSDLELDVDGLPDVSGGLSGAPILLAGSIVGVMRALPAGWDRKRFEATPVARFLGLLGFRKALGLDDHDARLRAELGELEAWLRERLAKVPACCATLAPLFPSQPESTAAALSKAILATPAAGLTAVLADVALTHPEVAKELFQRVLRLAVDWHEVLLQTRAANTSGARAIELQLRTETVAELVLAGVEGRDPAFAAGGVHPRGKSHVPLPAVLHAPLFHAEDTLLEGVLLNLAAPGVLDETTWRDLHAQYPDLQEYCTVVEAHLSRRLNPRLRAAYRPHYLLFVDADLRAKKIFKDRDDLDRAWALTIKTFNSRLPSLRLYRLTGALAELEAESPVADAVSTIISPKDPR